MKHIAFLLIAVGMLCMGVLGVSALDADVNHDGVTIHETDYSTTSTHVVDIERGICQAKYDAISYGIQGLHEKGKRQPIIDELVEDCISHAQMIAGLNAQAEAPVEVQRESNACYIISASGGFTIWAEDENESIVSVQPDGEALVSYRDEAGYSERYTYATVLYHPAEDSERIVARVNINVEWEPIDCN